MTLLKCVTNMPNTGECSIDLELAIKHFDKYSFISQWKETYRLVRLGHGRGNFKNLKVQISKEDAIFLIQELSLIKTNISAFRHAVTYSQAE